MSYEKALEQLSREERFRAALYAMNTLLIHKGVYTQQEFQDLFVEWASKERKRDSVASTRSTQRQASGA